MLYQDLLFKLKLTVRNSTEKVVYDLNIILNLF